MSKKPQAGEWWRMRCGQIRYVAVDAEDLGAHVDNSYPIITIGENANHTSHTREGKFLVSGEHSYDLTEHLPDCTGWDWKPETFPQYWTTASSCYAYMLRINAKQCCLVDKKGNQMSIGPWYDLLDRKGRTQLTKEYALERLDKPTPVESPDDWMIQDRVPARAVIDFGWWNSCIMTDVGTCDRWWTVHKAGSAVGKKHGHVASDGQILNLCCRRKDLPPLESPDDWVEITHTHPDHVPRVGIDWFTTWDDNPVDSSRWVKQEAYHTKKTVAAFLKESQGRHKCRRRDLPPITPPKPAMRTVTLYKWIVWDEEGEESERWQSDTPESWYNYYKTGESKTVEVPVDIRPDWRADLTAG